VIGLPATTVLECGARAGLSDLEVWLSIFAKSALSFFESSRTATPELFCRTSAREWVTVRVFDLFWAAAVAIVPMQITDTRARFTPLFMA
jgi:hypothetical protein